MTSTIKATPQKEEMLEKEGSENPCPYRKLKAADDCLRIG